MMKETLVSAVLALSLSSLAVAEAPSYNYVEASIQGLNVDLGPVGATLRGYGLEGSSEVGSRFFVGAGYANLDDKASGIKLDASNLTLGGGYRFYEQGETSAFASASYLRTKVSARGAGRFKAEGFGLGLGVRQNLSSDLEINGGVGYSDLRDDESLTWNVGGVWFATSQLGVTLDLSTSEGDFGFGLGARYQF